MDVSLPSSRSSGSPAWAVSAFVTTLGLWMGSAVFFSGVVLPTLFLGLESAQAGTIAALLFPHYFRLSLGFGVATTVVAAVVGRGGGRRWLAVIVLLGSMTATQAWTTLVIHPEMAVIRGVDSATPRFQKLHHTSVRLNGVVLAGGMLILGASGALLKRREPVA